MDTQLCNKNKKKAQKVMRGCPRLVLVGTSPSFKRPTKQA